MNEMERDKRTDLLRRTAKEVRGFHVKMKILSSLLIMLAVVAGVFYATSALYKNTGSFTVGVNKVDMIKYGLTLSEAPDMSHNTSHLNTQINEMITNIAGDVDIPADIDEGNGVKNGKNYIAYTFHLQNAGEVAFPVEYEVNMSGVTNGLDEAIRLRLYVDGVPTTYAKLKSSGEGAEPGTEPFYNAGIMAHGRIAEFAPGEVHRFTIVLWIEGTDPDCVDALIDGVLRAEMNMRVVH